MNKSTLLFVLLGVAATPLAVVACDDDDESGDTASNGTDAGTSPTATTTATTGDDDDTTPPTKTEDSGTGGTGDGGGAGGGDGGGNGKGKICDDLCTKVQATCTDKNEQYDDKDECLAECANYPVGNADAKSGNSINCRLYHVGVAAMKGMAKDHCPHTSKSGGGVCAD